MPENRTTPLAKIYENTNLTVTARISSRDIASIEAVTFKFLNDEAQFEEKTIPITGSPNPGEPLILTHTVQAPAVPEDKDRYFLDYQYSYKIKNVEGAESQQNFPSTRMQVFPRHARLKVTDKDGKAFPNFEFAVEQDGERSAVRKTFAADTANAKGETVPAGSCEFNLELSPGFRILPSSPYQMLEEVTGTGRKREIKGTVGYRAAFSAPRSGTVRQYVNYAVEAQGQTGIGHAVTVEVGIHPDDVPFLKPGEEPEVHFRVTFGPDSSEGVGKSAREDANYPTKVLKASDSDTSATIEEKEAGKKYQGKIALTGGYGKFVVALGKAGGDTCTVEIAGSAAFLDDKNVASDSTLTFENWRRVYYELMVPDIMIDRALDLTGEDRGRDWNLKAAVVQSLEVAGRQLFIEFVCAHVHPFNARKYADHGTLVPGRFLGSAGLEGSTAYVLSGRNWTRLPARQSWRSEYPGKTLYLHLCDALLKWRTGTADEKAGTVDFSSSLTEATGFINMQEKFEGYFFPFSGYDAGDGIEDVTWTADISKDEFADHPGLDDGGEPRTGRLSLREVTNPRKSTMNEWHFQLPLKDPRGGPGPGAFVGASKTGETCPITLELSVQPHESSAGEAEGRLIAWVSDPEDGARQLVRVVMKAFSSAKGGTRDDACVAHPHGDKGFPGDCLVEGVALCNGCIKHVRSRNLTNIP